MYIKFKFLGSVINMHNDFDLRPLKPEVTLVPPGYVGACICQNQLPLTNRSCV